LLRRYDRAILYNAEYLGGRASARKAANELLAEAKKKRRSLTGADEQWCF
jgi:hypothetical protein